eukprot:COSAG05_NODE_448_length_9744_cov_49.554277_2_plen_128_part_00
MCVIHRKPQHATARLELRQCKAAVAIHVHADESAPELITENQGAQEHTKVFSLDEAAVFNVGSLVGRTNCWFGYCRPITACFCGHLLRAMATASCKASTYNEKFIRDCLHPCTKAPTVHPDQTSEVR